MKNAVRVLGITISALTLAYGAVQWHSPSRTIILNPITA